MSTDPHLVVFALDEQRYALRLRAVERIVQVVQIDPLPKAPEIVMGVVNLQGRIIPVVSVRKRFRLPERELMLSDHMIVARTASKLVALVADSVEGVVQRSDAEITPAHALLPGLEYVDGVAKLEGGLLFIHDIDRFLSLDESSDLEAAMAATGKQ